MLVLAKVRAVNPEFFEGRNLGRLGRGLAGFDRFFALFYDGRILDNRFVSAFYGNAKVVEIAVEIHGRGKRFFGRNFGFVRINRFVSGGKSYGELAFRRGIISDKRAVICLFEVDCSLFGCAFYFADFFYWVPELIENLGFVRCDPRKIGLIVGIHARHKFYVTRAVVGEVGTPLATEIAVAPRPEFFSGRNVMIRDSDDTRFFAVVVTGNEVLVALPARNHHRSRNHYVFVMMNIGAFAVIERARGFVNAARNRPFENRPAVVVVYRFDVRREYDIVIVVDPYGEIRPPHKGTFDARAVIHGNTGAKAVRTGNKRQLGHTFKTVE